MAASSFPHHRGGALRKYADDILQAKKRCPPKPFVVFSEQAEPEVDRVLLLRFGPKVEESRQAAQELQEFLGGVLREVWSSPEQRQDFVITTMPDRKRTGTHPEHAFVQFTKQLAKDLQILCINDYFKEERQRREVSALLGSQGVKELYHLWSLHLPAGLSQHVVLLLDDVLVSGASLRVAATLLRKKKMRVIPIALITLSDEDSETKRVIRKYFLGRLDHLLRLDEVQGSLRALIEEVRHEELVRIR